jgi:hypothetical protein
VAPRDARRRRSRSRSRRGVRAGAPDVRGLAGLLAAPVGRRRAVAESRRVIIASGSREPARRASRARCGGLTPWRTETSAPW